MHRTVSAPTTPAAAVSASIARHLPNHSFLGDSNSMVTLRSTAPCTRSRYSPSATALQDGPFSCQVCVCVCVWRVRWRRHGSIIRTETAPEARRRTLFGSSSGTDYGG
jgi:hypothetical protein